MLQSVTVKRLSNGERCDLCNGPADLKLTNGAFFILVTCRACWAELERLVDDKALSA